MNKLPALCFVVCSLFILLACSSFFPSANAINWSICEAAANHHCVEIMPSSVSSATPNYFVSVTFPQNGAPVISGVLSNGNYTSFEGDVGIMNVQLTATTSSPNLNFCPLALASLEYQGTPSYLNKFYNASVIPPLNMTHSIYPDYCYPETGPNPVDGSGATTVPEFGDLAGFALLIGITSIIVLSSEVIRSKRI